METRISLARVDFWVRIDVNLVCWSSSVVNHQGRDHKATASGCRSGCQRQETKSDEVDGSLFKAPKKNFVPPTLPASDENTPIR